MNDSDPYDLTQDEQGNPISSREEVAARRPESIGRYHIERQLGRGGFGTVYLARDEQLDRLVAVKVPHARLVEQREDAQAYLTEARIVANLDHPGIVPIHDVGSTEDFPCFIISKYIEGSDLANRLKLHPVDYVQAAQLVASIAEALHYAHKQGLVHRDVKPGNILIGQDDKPYLVDFGLALREENIGKGPKHVGTPAYMSPEQARGEGHRVDGRSDIFSLGVVLYEMLVGRNPFRADTPAEILENVTKYEARPPRQYDDRIPLELERICQKAMGKRASERYSTAMDFAEDLRLFLAEYSTLESSSPPAGLAAPDSETQVTDAGMTPRNLSGSSPAAPGAGSATTAPIKVIPKGLRSFDAHDSDFYLELLPGPYDREGLPDSLRFWKTRIEETDPDRTFSVGLIYGPSGCGKSSLVKAGLLPRLSQDIVPVYIEATPDETEARLANGIRKQCPALEDHLQLKEMLAALRQGHGIDDEQKLVIILDQFEQWLQSHKDEDSELVQALRQCDGGNVQCIIMVRDDFWMAATRFMRDLEVRLVEAENSMAVDLFPKRHAENVLASFGRAFGALPADSQELDQAHQAFIEESVESLAEEGKVICVRLALFAEMMKSKAWVPSSLREVGGAAGVGLTFLEETFSSSTAPPQHRYHQDAARAVLKALLPDSGNHLKGAMRSYEFLLQVSGYERNPGDFEDLIDILNRELRLITLTDPEGVSSGDDSRPLIQDGQRYYQLTHDYLVDSLREWLTRKQKETPRGRAELLLEDRAAVWNARPENRQLPSLVQWLQIKRYTSKQRWTLPQQKMMARAGRYHATQAILAASLLVFAVCAGLLIRHQLIQERRKTYAKGLVERLLDAQTGQVPAIIEEMSGYRESIDPLLETELHKSPENHRQRLHLELALLPVDRQRVDSVYQQMLSAEPSELLVIRDMLSPFQAELDDRLWETVQSSERGTAPYRLRAAAALAAYEPESANWDDVSDDVAGLLVSENPVYVGFWMDYFRPVKKKLLAALEDIYRDVHRDESDRRIATNILAEYAVDDPQTLTELLLDADVYQFHAIYPVFKLNRDYGRDALVAQIGEHPPSEAGADAGERQARRTTNAAVGLLRLGETASVWPLLKHSPNPQVRSYLIDRMAAMGVDPAPLIKQLVQENDITVRRALILSLGEFPESEIAQSDRLTLIGRLQDAYLNDVDAGIHGTSEWLLRRWGQQEWLGQADRELSHNKSLRDRVIEAWRTDSSEMKQQWYVNSQAQTMAVLPGPAEFLMGSPETERDRKTNEILHLERINRIVAISTKTVTLGEYRRFDMTFKSKTTAFQEDRPVAAITWYDAAEYCNWLSLQEGLEEDQWCYIIDGNGISLKESFLSLAGYRLPTEAEFEYAARAGAVTSRCYGDSDDLLDKYAWYQNNSGGRTHTAGELKPNDFGLFDIHGNIFSWCQDIYQPYTYESDLRRVFDDLEGDLTVPPKTTRCVRGGAWADSNFNVRSAVRYHYVPDLQIYSIGFRTARTLAAFATPAAQ